MLNPIQGDIKDRAEDEYTEFRPRPLRTERRRIWNGKRYAWRLCQVYDAGAQQNVDPSTDLLVACNMPGNQPLSEGEAPHPSA